MDPSLRLLFIVDICTFRFVTHRRTVGVLSFDAEPCPLRVCDYLTTFLKLRSVLPSACIVHSLVDSVE